MKVSHVFYPNKAKRSTKTGKIPIYLRICLNGKKAETRLNEEVTDQELLMWDEFTMRFKDRKFKANRTLTNIDQKVHDFLYQNATALPRFTAKQVRDFVMGTGGPARVTVIDYIDNYFATAVLNNAELVQGTVKGYRKAINHMKKFLAFKKAEDIALTEFTKKTALEFKDYLTRNNPEKDRKGMTEPSAAGNIKKFKTIFSRAVDEGLMDSNPFKGIKLNNTSPRRPRLTASQVKQLWKLDLNNFPAQRLYRDIFLFSTFTGLAYKDALKLNYQDLDQRPDGNILMTLSRTKTEEPVKSFLTSYAIEIAHKYKNNPENQITNCVLPSRSNQKINIQLKMIAELANIPVKLTTHIARHTFRQLLAEAGIEDDGVIKKMMGQKRRDIDSVYYEVTESRLFEAKRRFELFLGSTLLHDREQGNITSHL